MVGKYIANFVLVNFTFLIADQQCGELIKNIITIIIIIIVVIINIIIIIIGPIRAKGNGLGDKVTLFFGISSYGSFPSISLLLCSVL